MPCIESALICYITIYGIIRLLPFHEIILLCFNENGNANGVFIGTADQDRFDTLLELFGWDNWLYTSYDEEDDEECYEE